jgi:glycosyltransferase involved in cell wall biosynthesis
MSKSQPELVNHYRDADCLVLPSRFDSFGMVVAEALACGLPVIVSDMVGAKSLVVEGENGWIVPVGDVEALARRMRWCVEHRPALAEMRINAARSAQRASWPHYHQRLIATLDGIFRDRTA